MEERLDIFTEDFNYLGEATRQETHQNGYWHQTFHCWVVHQKEKSHYLLLQKRHADKDTNPLKLDTSCAGHLEAGESPKDGVRELQEELGIAARFDSLHKVGLIKYEGEDIGKKVIDREFCHVFVMVRDVETLDDYKPALGEVSGLYLISLEEMKQVCRGEKQSVQIEGYAMDDLGTKEQQNLKITLDDFVKNELSYYEMLFTCLDQLSKKNKEMSNLELRSHPMTKVLAIEILNWSYNPPYNFYNIEVSDRAIREFLNGTYQVIKDVTGDLIGFYCTGEDARVFSGKRVGAYDEDRIDVGLGMKPALTGQGKGEAFLKFLLNQVREKHQGKGLRLTVAAFNQRAIHLYEKVGFRKQLSFSREDVEFMTMVMD